MPNKPVKWSLKFTFTLSLNEANMKYVWKRMFEPSSWAGIGLCISAGNQIAESGLNQATIGMLLAALVAFFMPGKVIADAPPQPQSWPGQTHRPIDRN